MQLKKSTPTNFPSYQWEDDKVLVLGAAYIGKSHLFRNHDDIKRITTLAGALNYDGSERLVVDEFYRGYQAADAETREEFASWFVKSKGVCISTRPRAFDWLLEQDNESLKAIVESLDTTYHLRYDLEKDRKSAINCCLQIGGQGDDGLNHKAVDKYIDEVLVCPEYDFKNQTLINKLGTDIYSPTYAPGLVTYFSDQLGDASKAFTPQSLVKKSKETGREFLENVALTNVINQFNIQNILSWETLMSINKSFDDSQSLVNAVEQISSLDYEKVSDITPSGIFSNLLPFLGPAATGAGVLAFWLKLRDDDTVDTSEILNVLASDELTPTARVEFERELNLPPRTLDNFHRLIRGNVIEQLLRYRNQSDEKFKSIHDDIESIEAKLDKYEEEFELIQKTVSNISSQPVDSDIIVTFVSEGIENSTHNVNKLGDWLMSDENLYMKEYFDQGDIPFFGDEVKKLFEKTYDNNIIILKGTHGTGKTTAAYKTGEIIEESGGRFLIPNFNKGDYNHIRHKLATSEGDRNILYTQYSYQPRGSTFERIDVLENLISFLQEDLCETLIIECRDEFYSRIDKDDAKKLDRAKKRIWRDKEVIEFEERSEEQIKSIAKWVSKQKGWDGEIEKHLPEIRKIAGQNPEIVKIATRVLCEKGSIDEFKTKDDLIWDDINNIFSGSDKLSYEQQKILEYSSAGRGITRSQISEIRGWNDELEIDEYRDSLGGYLDVRDREERIWTIKPDIYLDVIFRKSCLDKFDSILTNFINAEQPELITSLATNIHIAYNASRKRNDSEQAERCIKKGDLLLDEIITNEFYHPGIKTLGETTPYDIISISSRDPYYQSIITLILGGVPINPENFHIEWFLELNGGDENKVDISLGDPYSKDSGEVTISVPALVLYLTAQASSTYIKHDELQKVSAIEDSVGAFCNHFFDQGEYQDLIQLLHRYYSFTIRLATDNWEFDQLNEKFINTRWYDQVERLVIDTGDRIGEREFFIWSFYSDLISYIVEDCKPNTGKILIDQIDDHINEASKWSGSPLDFVFNLYALAITKMMDGDSISGIEGWINIIETKVIDSPVPDMVKNPTIEGNIDINNSIEFVIGLYQIVTLRLSERNYEDRKEEYAIIKERVLSLAEDSDSNQMLFSYYLQIFEQISESNVPNNRENWLKVWLDSAFDNLKNDELNKLCGNLLTSLIDEDKIQPQWCQWLLKQEGMIPKAFDWFSSAEQNIDFEEKVKFFRLWAWNMLTYILSNPEHQEELLTNLSDRFKELKQIDEKLFKKAVNRFTTNILDLRDGFGAIGQSEYEISKITLSRGPLDIDVSQYPPDEFQRQITNIMDIWQEQFSKETLQDIEGASN